MMIKLTCAAAALLALSSAAAEEADPYLWLENVEGEKALDWVRGQNKRSLEDLESDPRFEAMYKKYRVRDQLWMQIHPSFFHSEFLLLFLLK